MSETRFAIAYMEYHSQHDEWRPAYWTTRCGDGDNYSFMKSEATTFSSIDNAKDLMDVLDLDDDHFIVTL